MKRKICFITGTRAEYGLLRQLIIGASKDKSIYSQLIVTGTHLSKLHGLTYKEIEADGILISQKINLRIKGDTAQDVLSAMSHALNGFSSALSNLKPDLIVLLGDRYEIFAAASAATILNIPIAHIHGGETTEGAYDEAMRHSITKMSHIHFVAAAEYKRRVRQLGEDLKNIFLVGGLGVDAIHGLKLLSKTELEKELNLLFGKKNLLITVHPETLEKDKSSQDQVRELLSSLRKLKDTKFIFTLPNADTNNLQISKMIKKFQSEHPESANIYTSLGQIKYLSALRFMDGVIGNSSSGLLEAPSFKIGTINIGGRQSGRLKARSVIDVTFERAKISKAINHLYSKTFQNNLSKVINPYGKPGASKKILKIIKNFPLENIIKKQFHDL